MNIRQVNLSHIRRDGGTQARADMNQSAIEDYAQAMEAGAKFPPVVLFQDQDTYWLGDGFHRVAAAVKAGKKGIQADIRQGGQRQARLFALGANSTHGVRRTNADKRLAVSILLDDPEWSQWSNRQISEVVGVSHQFINNMRNERVATVATHVTAESEEAEEIPDPPIHANDLADALNDTACDVSKEPERRAALQAPPAPKARPLEPNFGAHRIAELEATLAERDAKIQELEAANAAMLEQLEAAQADLEAAQRILDVPEDERGGQTFKELQRANALNVALQTRNNGLMGHNAGLAKDLKRLNAKCERLQKSLDGFQEPEAEAPAENPYFDPEAGPDPLIDGLGA